MRSAAASGGLGAGGEELSAALVSNADLAQLRTSGELRKLLVSVEVTLARDRLRGSWRPAQFRAGRVDGDAAASSLNAPTANGRRSAFANTTSAPGARSRASTTISSL